jgi:serine/threonine-protein kinase
MAIDRRCPRCGRPLPPDVPPGICPACLLRAGLEPGTGAAPLDDPADEELTFGFEPTSPGHVLESLARSIGSIPRVLLPDTAPDDQGVAIIKPSSEEMPPPGERGERYQLFGEIARGGMGAILKGRDPDLGRDLAVKVLLEGHRGKPELVRRFVEEAQIGGQLQHPGIVPVYELGTFADRRPYFTMKLVKGRTLAALLHARNSPQDELPRFLDIFEQVCQTVAYAHARGVIHRDLKPANVMVGSFGEVQVMDWGLAKVLKEGGVADERPAPPEPEASVIRTVRSKSDVDDSQPGSVLGTPAYMAPEQAGGHVEDVDRRADVFSLGSILCEVLTGQAPYTGRTAAEVLRKAMRGDTADALGQLDGCGAAAELVALAKDCLAVDPEDRPRDAGALAGRVTAYLAEVQERLKAAELARAAEQARAEEARATAAAAEARVLAERRARRLTVVLAAAVLGLVMLGGGGGAYLTRQRAVRLAATSRAVNQALGEARLSWGEARTAVVGDLSKWSEALSAARRAQALLEQGETDATTRGQVQAVLAGLERERDDATTRAAEAERDRRLVERLEAIRGGLSEHGDYAQTAADYAGAFRAHGLDVERVDPMEAGAWIARRSAAVELAAALDDWVLVRRRGPGPGGKASWHRLLAAARTADPDRWRNALRDQIGRNDVEALRRLTEDKGLATQPPQSLVLLAQALRERGDFERAASVLQAGWREHPDDFWINFKLGSTSDDLFLRRLGSPKVEGLNRREEAIRYYTAAVAIRSRSFVAHNNLGLALHDSGQLDAAIAELHAALCLQPDSAMVHNNLGLILRDKGQLDESIAEYRTALRLQPDYAQAHYNLGLALGNKGERDAAIAEYRTAIGLQPDYTNAHINLGVALDNKGEHDAAIAEFHAAIRLQPDAAEIHSNLGNALRAKGQLDAAIAACRAALRLKPDLAGAHHNLGNALADKGQLDAAIAEYRAALRLKPDLAVAHHCLGLALSASGQLDEAIAAYRMALRLQPDLAAADLDLGNALTAKGQLEESIAEYRTALRLQPDYAQAHYNLGNALRDSRRLDEAIAAYRAAIRLQPDVVSPHNNLGIVLCAKGQYDAAIAEFHVTLCLKPDHVSAHYNLGLALAAQGKRDAAIAELRAAIRLKPDYPEAHANLGNALRAQGNLKDALAEFRRAAELAPAGSLVARAMPGLIRQVEQQIALEGRLPAVLKGQDRPKGSAEGLTFVQLCYDRGLHAAAARLWSEALEADAKLGDDRRAQHRYNAACAAALAGCGKGKDDPRPDETAKAKFRNQAIDWLKAERVAWAKLLEAGPPQVRPVIAQTLQHWQQNADLAGVRDPEALAKLPVDEQKAWRALWADVDALVKKARGNRP